jgi:hypothetical protein
MARGTIMKRYEIAGSEYSYMSEASNGDYVLYAEAQKHIEELEGALRKLGSTKSFSWIETPPNEFGEELMARIEYARALINAGKNLYNK